MPVGAVSVNTPVSPVSGAQYLTAPPPAKRSLVLPLALTAVAVIAIGIVAVALLLRPAASTGPLPDHFGLFVRTNDNLNELRRTEFRDLMKARAALMEDATLPQLESKPSLILFSEGNDIPINDLKLIQLDAIDASGKVNYWEFQVSPVEGQAGCGNCVFPAGWQPANTRSHCWTVSWMTAIIGSGPLRSTPMVKRRPDRHWSRPSP
jgi:hypothetical protein